MNLPLEIREKIASSLSFVDILNLCSSQKDWYEICTDESFWKYLTFTRYGKRDKKDFPTWKTYFSSLESFSTRRPFLTFSLILEEEDVEEEYITLGQYLDDLLSSSNFYLDLNQEINYLNKDNVYTFYFSLLWREAVTVGEFTSFIKELIIQIDDNYSHDYNFFYCSYSLP